MMSEWMPLLAIVAGSLLTAFGSLVNDLLASRRQRLEWKRQDDLRQEDQTREDNRLMAEQRVRAYKAFAVAATFTPPLRSGEDKENRHRALSETFTDVLLHASDHVSKPAQHLHRLASKAAMYVNEEDVTPAVLEHLEEAREAFWSGVRVEMKDIPYESRTAVA